jgi:hypothetical protein
VKNAFLHGTLSETAYYAQAAGVEDRTHPDFVCQHNRSLYGLKQAPVLGTMALLHICSV